MKSINHIIGFVFLLSFSFNANAANAQCDVMLKQSDFDQGTYIIDAPGKYCLHENISFNPNSVDYLNRTSRTGRVFTAYESAQPHFTYMGGKYDPAAFALGFFAAIAVASPDVIIDLQGKTIEQSKEHALLQRFFAVIETADRPFIHGQGPADFGSIVGAAENLVIQNGTIGRSAHHGIHGNRAKNVTIKNIDFVDFEVAAVAMNGVDGLKLENLTAKSREDVPVLGQFSTAQFIKQYINALVRIRANVTFKNKTALQMQADLKQAINNVYNDVIKENREFINKDSHPFEWRMFHNKEGVVDGNSYGFLINGVGVAVDGFPTTQSTNSPTRNVTIKNVKIKKLKANIREILSLSNGDDSQVNDPVGSLFQLMAVDPNGKPLALTSADESGKYLGNVITDAQALVAKAIHQGLFHGSPIDVSRNSISKNLISWAESGAPLSAYISTNKGPNGTGFICNGDQMFHVNKGVIGFKLDGAINVKVMNSGADSISNIGQPSSNACGNYSISHPKATLEGYGGAATRAVSISGSKDVELTNMNFKDIYSFAGCSIGIDVQTDSKGVTVKKLEIKKNLSATVNQEMKNVRISTDATNVNIN